MGACLEEFSCLTLPFVHTVTQVFSEPNHHSTIPPSLFHTTLLSNLLFPSHNRPQRLFYKPVKLNGRKWRDRRLLATSSSTTRQLITVCNCLDTLRTSSNILNADTFGAFLITIIWNYFLRGSHFEEIGNSCSR